MTHVLFWSLTGLLPDHETADGQSEPAERGEGMGADVAGHRAVRLQPGTHEGADSIPEDPAAPHRPGLDTGI